MPLEFDLSQMSASIFTSSAVFILSLCLAGFLWSLQVSAAPIDSDNIYEYQNMHAQSGKDGRLNASRENKAKGGNVKETDMLALDPMAYDLSIVRSAESGANLKPPASIEPLSVEKQVRDRKLYDENIKNEEKPRSRSKESGDSSSSLISLLSYSFFAILVIAAFVGLNRYFKGNDKKTKKKKKKKGRSKVTESNSTTKSSLTRKHRKRKEKEKQQSDGGETNADTAGQEPNNTSYFVPLPDDDEVRGERYRQRRKERRARRRLRRERKRSRREKRRQERHHRSRGRHRKKCEHQDSEMSTEELTERDRSTQQNDENSQSISEFSHNDSSPSILQPGAAELQQSKFNEPVVLRMHRDDNPSVSHRLTGLDQNTVFFVVKSAICGLDNEPLFVERLSQNAAAVNQELPKGHLDLVQVVPAMSKSKQAAPRSQNTISPESSPPDSTILYQSRTFVSLKSNGSQRSMTSSDSNFKTKAKQRMNPKAVLDEIVRKMRPSSIAQAEVISVPLSKVTPSKQLKLESNKLATKSAVQDNLRGELGAPITPHPKSILRRSISSYNGSSSLKSPGGKANSRIRQSLKRVSFSRKMEVRYIKSPTI